MKVFGIKSIAVRLVVFLVLLSALFTSKRAFIKTTEDGFVFFAVVLLCAIIILSIRQQVITVERNILKCYDLRSYLTRKPALLYLDTIREMHIIQVSGKGGGTQTHFRTSEGDTTLHTHFIKADIRSLERFMMEKEVLVHHPD